MNIWLGVILGVIGGGGAGVAIAWGIWLARRAALQAQIANALARAGLLDQQVADHVGEISRLRAEQSHTDQAREAAERDAAVLREQLLQKQQQFQEQQRVLAEAEKKLTTTFEAAGAKALRDNNQQFLELAKKTFETLMTEAKGDVEKKQQAIDNLVKPIRELLEKQNTAVGDIEKKRESAYARLDEQIKAIACSHDGLRAETGRLVSALRRPEQRGRWGEMQLRNAVEMAGMTPHCDFVEQPTLRDGDTTLRPDMVIRMPGGGSIAVDSKVALDAYLDLLQPDCDRESCLKRHAQQVSHHYRSLASKRYWEQFERAPKIVVMFMALEPALTAALETNPDLHAEAMRNNVLIATPTLLVALLRAVAYGWQQEDVAANARQIAETGRELYERLANFVAKFQKVGAQIEDAAKAYNGAIGSLESRLLPSARKLKELNATTEADVELPAAIEIEMRPIIAAELTEKEASDTFF